MKKYLVCAICFVILFTLTLSVSSAEGGKPDIRELEEYGQQHFYLGDPIDKSEVPNSKDAKVSEGEYYISYEYKKGDKCSKLSDQDSKAKIIDNDSVKVYMSYDEKTFYVAIETNDRNYIKGKDGFGINIGLRDAGRPVDAISRYCFDIQAHANAEEGDITTLKTNCRRFSKKDNGDWDNPPNIDGMFYINDISMDYDEKTQITTVEVAFDMHYLLMEMDNALPIDKVRMYFIPFVYMYGESTLGAGDVVCQGVLWSYLPSDYVSSLKSQFAAAYPEATYWSGMIPNIVHFSADPKFTTTVVTTTPAETTSVSTTVQRSDTEEVATTAQVTTEAANTEGCQGVTLFGALPIAIGGIALTFVNYKKED